MKNFGTIQSYLANTYVFNVSNRNTRKRCDICSKLTIKKSIHRHMSMKCFLFFTGQQGKGGDHLLFHSTTCTLSWTFRNLFATSQVRWLSHIFNRNACIHQTATRWDLPPNYNLIDWSDVDFRSFACWFDFIILKWGEEICSTYKFYWCFFPCVYAK